MLITLYGINNIGKSTQAKRLVKRLEESGREVVYVKYPVYDIGPSGPFINNILRGGVQDVSEDELQMWFVLNRYQYQDQLKAHLAAGKIVIAEDYVGTGIAWGVAKGLKLEWLESLNKHLIEEDLAILFEGKRRMGAKEDGHVHEQDDDLVEKCAVVHRDLGKKYGWKVLQVQDGINRTTDSLWAMVSAEL